MSPVTFPQANIVLGKNQPEYLPLPAHRTEDGNVTCRWEFTKEEIDRMSAQAAEGNPVGVFVTQMTFGGALQPIMVNPEFIPLVRKPRMPMAQPPLRRDGLEVIADKRGLSGGFAFAMDAESLPGKCLVHFVRVETIAFDNGEEPVGLKFLRANEDERIDVLAASFQAPLQVINVELFKWYHSP